MTSTRTAAFAVLLSMSLVGCEDGITDTGLEVSDLAGTWDASTLTFSPTEDDSESNPVPFVALGGDLVVTITSDGAFTGTLTIPGAITASGEPEDLPVAGTMSLTEDPSGADVLDVDFDTNTESIFAQAGLPFEDFDGPIDFTSSRITVTNETTFDFDFGGANPEEPALLLLVLDKTG